jgi:hypothetical protein
VCFCKGVKGGNIKSFKKVIKGLFKKWGVNNKGVKVKNIRTVLKHKDKISYNNIIIKAKGLVKG